MKFLLQIIIIVSLYLLNCKCSVEEGYKLSEWKKENLQKMKFEIQKGLQSDFSINLAIPFLWENATLGIQVFVSDKESNKIDSINFQKTDDLNENKYLYQAQVTLAEFQKINCEEKYLDSKETIIRAQCETVVEFYDKEAEETIYLKVNYLFSIQYSTVASVIFNGIPIEEQQDCPCCDTDCIEDSNIAEIEQSINTNSIENAIEESKVVKIDIVNEDSQVFYTFNTTSAALRQLNEDDNQELILKSVYVENDIYQADLTDYVNITKTDDQIFMSTNLLTPAESIGKYFGFRFIFTNNELDIDGNYKAKILQSKTIVIDDLEINYVEVGDSEINNDSNTTLIIILLVIVVVILGIGIVIIIAIKKRQTAKHSEKKLVMDNDQELEFESKIINNQNEQNEGERKKQKEKKFQKEEPKHSEIEQQEENQQKKSAEAVESINNNSLLNIFKEQILSRQLIIRKW